MGPRPKATTKTDAPPAPPVDVKLVKAAGRKRKAAAAAPAPDDGAPGPGPSSASSAVATEAANPSAGSRRWLIKQEPEEFSWEDLLAQPNQTWAYDGVRNHQARNNLRAMGLGDQLLLHYSSCKPPRIVGIVEVAREAYPDHNAWDPGNKYYDAKSTKDAPIWYMIDIKAVCRLPRDVPLPELREVAAADDADGSDSGARGVISGMLLLNRPRLSVQAVTQAQWDRVLALAEQAPPDS